MKGLYIKEYIPRSWFHPKGVLKVVDRIKPHLPDVNGSLFVTLTLNRQWFRTQQMGPSEAYDFARGHIRKMFFKLRHGISWEDKKYTIKSAYCTKVEFHDDEEGWPHFHIIWLTKRYIPCDLLASLWGYGRINISRINNTKFNYILKYICKSGKVPNWVKTRNSVRIFQPSRGFLNKSISPKKKSISTQQKSDRKPSTIGERVNAFGKTALVIDDRFINQPVHYRQIELKDKFHILLDRLVYSIAQDGRYLGDGKILIIEMEDFYPWIKLPNH